MVVPSANRKTSPPNFGVKLAWPDFGPAAELPLGRHGGGLPCSAPRAVRPANS